MLALVRRVFFGTPAPAAIRTADDLDQRKTFVALLFALLVVGIGFFPGPLYDSLSVAGHEWVAAMPAPR